MSQPYLPSSEALEQAMLEHVHRPLALVFLLGGLVSLGVIVLTGIASVVLGDPSIRLPTIPAVILGAVLVPLNVAGWAYLRSRPPTVRLVTAVLVVLCNVPFLIGMALLTLHPEQLVRGAIGIMPLLMVGGLTISTVMLNPRLSLGLGLMTTAEYLVIFALARATVRGLPITEPSILALTAWGEGVRRLAILLAVTVVTALVGVGSRRVVQRLLQEAHQREAAEREMQQTEARRAMAEAASEAKSAFVATMSHELRTPMNAILGFAQRLERAPELSEESRRGVAVILDNSRHMLGLIGESLDAAAIEAGRLTLYPAPVAIRALVEATVALLQPRAEEAGLRLSAAVGPCVPERIIVDEKRLRQVLLNLLSNALKFTGQGQIMLVLSSPEPDGLLVEVRDTGAGIPAERLATLFDRFAQAGDAAQRQKGTGLGLSITREIVEAMGGRITLQSTPGEGTTASVTLPLEAAPVTEEVPLVRFPDPEGRAWLRESALMGDMQEIVRRADALAAQDPALAPFTDRVRALADEFDDDAILSLLDEAP